MEMYETEPYMYTRWRRIVWKAILLHQVLKRSVRQWHQSRLRPETVQVKPDLKVGAADVLYVGHSVELWSGTHVVSDIRSDSYSHVIIQFASQKLSQSATFAVPAIVGADFFIKGLKPPLKSTFRLDGSRFRIIVDTLQSFITIHQHRFSTGWALTCWCEAWT